MRGHCTHQLHPISECTHPATLCGCVGSLLSTCTHTHAITHAPPGLVEIREFGKLQRNFYCCQILLERLIQQESNSEKYYLSDLIIK